MRHYLTGNVHLVVWTLPTRMVLAASSLGEMTHGDEEYDQK
jgi:hypothetical protein